MNYQSILSKFPLPIQVFLFKSYDYLYYFYSDGYIDLYKKIFGSAQFPFWYIIYVVWTLVIVRRSFSLDKSRKELFHRFIESFTIVFLPREILAIASKKPSPIISSPLSVILFLVIFFAFYYSPWDIIYRAVNCLSVPLGFCHGFNQIRRFAIVMRNFNSSQPLEKLVHGVFFCELDSIIEILFRYIWKGKRTSMSNILTIYRFFVLSVVYYMFTSVNPLTPKIGNYPIHIPSLLFGLIQGIFNSSSMMTFLD